MPETLLSIVDLDTFALPLQHRLKFIFRRELGVMEIAFLQQRNEYVSVEKLLLHRGRKRCQRMLPLPIQHLSLTKPRPNDLMWLQFRKLQHGHVAIPDIRILRVKTHPVCPANLVSFTGGDDGPDEVLPASEAYQVLREDHERSVGCIDASYEVVPAEEHWKCVTVQLLACPSDAGERFCAGMGSSSISASLQM